jgi:hypothetical protein
VSSEDSKKEKVKKRVSIGATTEIPLPPPLPLAPLGVTKKAKKSQNIVVLDSPPYPPKRKHEKEKRSRAFLDSEKDGDNERNPVRRVRARINEGPFARACDMGSPLVPKNLPAFLQPRFVLDTPLRASKKNGLSSYPLPSFSSSLKYGPCNRSTHSEDEYEYEDEEGEEGGYRLPLEKLRDYKIHKRRDREGGRERDRDKDRDRDRESNRDISERSARTSARLFLHSPSPSASPPPSPSSSYSSSPSPSPSSRYSMDVIDQLLALNPSGPDQISYPRTRIRRADTMTTELSLVLEPLEAQEDKLLEGDKTQKSKERKIRQNILEGEEREKREEEEEGEEESSESVVIHRPSPSCKSHRSASYRQENEDNNENNEKYEKETKEGKDKESFMVEGERSDTKKYYIRHDQAQAQEGQEAQEAQEVQKVQKAQEAEEAEEVEDAEEAEAAEASERQSVGHGQRQREAGSVKMSVLPREEAGSGRGSGIGIGIGNTGLGGNKSQIPIYGPYSNPLHTNYYILTPALLPPAPPSSSVPSCSNSNLPIKQSHGTPRKEKGKDELPSRRKKSLKSQIEGDTQLEEQVRQMELPLFSFQQHLQSKIQQLLRSKQGQRDPGTPETPKTPETPYGDPCSPPETPSPHLVPLEDEKEDGDKREKGTDRRRDETGALPTQNLCIMSIEILCKTRGNLTPNPQHDPVLAVFFSVRDNGKMARQGIKYTDQLVAILLLPDQEVPINNPAERKEEEEGGNVEPKGFRKQIFPGLFSYFPRYEFVLLQTIGVRFTYVNTEVELFAEFNSEVTEKIDPDIILGYDVQRSSLVKICLNLFFFFKRKSAFIFFLIRFSHLYVIRGTWQNAPRLFFPMLGEI